MVLFNGNIQWIYAMVLFNGTIQCYYSIVLFNGTHQIPIGDLSETNMPDQRPIGELDMLHRRLTCPSRDQHA